MSVEMRVEKDPLGPLEVPASALYGVQTQRALQNFPISGQRPLEPFVIGQVWIKKAAAMTHRTTGRLDARLADAIIAAADEVLAGQHRDPFGGGGGRAGIGLSGGGHLRAVDVARVDRCAQPVGGAVHHVDRVLNAGRLDDGEHGAEHLLAGETGIG